MNNLWQILFGSKRILIWFLIVVGVYTGATLYGYRLLDAVSREKPEVVDDSTYGSQHK
ncbi:MAG: hypothetical protein K1X54_14825 [Flavobacteriales bacterium]|nr:hypothetical protein [Flavobacteriales bacterium]